MNTTETINLLINYQQSIDSILNKGVEQFLGNLISRLNKNQIKDTQFIYILMWRNETEGFNLSWCLNNEILKFQHYQNNELFKNISEHDLNKKPIYLESSEMMCIKKVLEYKYNSNIDCLITINPFNNDISVTTKDYYES
jgi:hypothetical protein